MSNTVHSILLIAVLAVVTALLRFLPFLLFPEGKPVPESINYLGRVLPYAVMGMLVVYCLRNATPLSYPYGLPELIAGVIVAALHIWRKNTLLSIASGVVSYMLLVQVIFK